MPLSIRIPDASFSNFVDEPVPYVDLAEAYFLFGDGAASAQNLAPNGGGGAATIAGAPTYGKGWIGLTPAAYLDTGITPAVAGDRTMIAIATNAIQTYCGTWHSGITGDMLFHQSSSLMKVAVRGSGSGITSLTLAQGAKFAFMAGVKSGVNTGTVYAHNGTTMLSSTGAGGTDATPNTYRIGPNGGVGNQADTTVQRHAVNMLFPVALTAGQINALYDYFKTKLARRGVEML